MSSPRKIPLRQWLAENGVTMADFAERVGVETPTVSRWCSGDSFPRRRALERIAQETAGAVTADSFAEVRAAE